MPTPNEIRCDDLFIGKHLTGSMKNSLKYNTFFGHFLDFDRILAARTIPYVVTIVADGIELYPEWVEYVKANKYRYTIELHCWSHEDHRNLTAEEGYEQLARAKALIEKTFDVEVKHWYVPFGRMRFPQWSLDVCAKLNLEFNTRGIEKQRFFHYWNSRDRNFLKRILNVKQS